MDISCWARNEDFVSKVIHLHPPISLVLQGAHGPVHRRRSITFKLGGMAEREQLQMAAWTPKLLDYQEDDVMVVEVGYSLRRKVFHLLRELKLPQLQSA